MIMVLPLIMIFKCQFNKFSIKKFYMRRMLRIFPLYYLIVIFGFIVNHFILPQAGFAVNYDYDLSNSILLTTFFLSNIYCYLYEVVAIHQVIWSIGIEEQFYIMIAPFANLIKKQWLLKALIVFTVGYFILFHFSGIVMLQKLKMFFFFLFFGGLISILEEKKKLEFLKTSKIIPLLIIILTILYFTTNVFDFKNLALKNFTSTLLLGLFIHSISCNNFGVIIKDKAFNYLGKISYGIYMFHISAIYFVLFLFLKVDFLKGLNDITVIILINILAFLITILISHVSYQYFELKFLALKNKFRD